MYSTWKKKVQDSIYFETVRDVCEMGASRGFMECWNGFGIRNLYILEMHGKFWEVHAAVGTVRQAILVLNTENKAVWLITITSIYF